MRPADLLDLPDGLPHPMLKLSDFIRVKSGLQLSPHPVEKAD